MGAIGVARWWGCRGGAVERGLRLAGLSTPQGMRGYVLRGGDMWREVIRRRTDGNIPTENIRGEQSIRFSVPD